MQTHGQVSMHGSSRKIPFLPEELITEILLRLPVKSLLQFRCVSKSWLALISSPKFVKTHLSIAANNKDYTHHRLFLKLLHSSKINFVDCSLSSLLSDSIAARAFELDYPMKDSNKGASILGSVNGLICFYIAKQGFFLWNPSLRKLKKLSDPGGGYYWMYGIGYDEYHDDYKVLVIFYTLHHDNVRIYSLNSDSWTSLDDFQSEGLFMMKTKGMFVNGKLHWSKSNFQTFHSYNGWDIISIDLSDGKWGKLEMPYYGQGDFDLTPWVTVLGSDLSVFCNYKSFHTDVWIMKVYGVKESWTKLYSTINSIDDPVKYYIPIFWMLNKGEILFQFGSSFMIYNPKGNSIRYEKITNCYSFWDENIYIESLVWPFCQNESGMQQ